MVTVNWRTIVLALVLLSVVAPFLLSGSSQAVTVTNDSVNETRWSENLTSVDAGYPNAFVADVIVTSDGYLVAGSTLAKHGGTTGYLAKVARNGTIEWEKTPEPFGNGGILAGTALGDGDYVFVGWKDDGMHDVGGDLFIARYGPEADTTWSHRWQIGEPSEDLVDSGKLLDVVTTESGDVIAVGQGLTNESRETDYIAPRRGGFVYRLDQNGTIESYNELPKGVGGITRLPNRTGYVVTQKRITQERGPDVWRLDADGNRTAGWSFTPGSDYAAEPVSHNGTLYAVTNTGNLVAFDGNGRLQWRRNLSRTVTELVIGPTGTVILAAESRRSESGTVEIQWYTQDGKRRAVGPAFATVRELQRADNRTLVAVGTRKGEAQVMRLPLRPPDPEVVVSTRVLDNETNLVTLNASQSTAVTNVTAYEWDLDGDGAVDRTTTTPTVQHRYDQQGYPHAAVTVVSSGGLATTETVRVNITDTLSPVPALSIPSNGLVAAGATATFDASASSDNIAITEYRWDFDADGTVDRITETPIVKHEYGGVNETHQLAVTVVDGQNNTNTSTFTVRSVENDKPSVVVDSDLAVVDRETVLIPRVTDRVGTITTVHWQFPDGSTLETNGTQRVRYRFNETGPRTVQVVVRDEYGAATAKNVTVDVRKNPPAHAGFGGGALGLFVVLILLVYYHRWIIVLTLVLAGLYWLVRR